MYKLWEIFFKAEIKNNETSIKSVAKVISTVFKDIKKEVQFLSNQIISSNLPFGKLGIFV